MIFGSGLATLIIDIRTTGIKHQPWMTPSLWESILIPGFNICCWRALRWCAQYHSFFPWYRGLQRITHIGESPYCSQKYHYQVWENRMKQHVWTLQIRVTRIMLALKLWSRSCIRIHGTFAFQITKLATWLSIILCLRACGE